jgi:hypothetical protein
MAVMGRDDVAEATKCTGELSVEPGAGELIVTPANADAASIKVTMTYRIGLGTALSSLGLRFLINEEQR